MALKEVKKPEKAEEQAKVAEELIKAPPPFAAPVPVKLTPEEEKLSIQMDKAYDSVAELADYSKKLEKQLPVDVNYESKKLLADLEKTKLQEKEVLGELRYKDETADIEKTIKDAQKSEEAGKHEDAVEMIKNAKKKMELLGEIIEVQRNLAVAGAPSSLIDDIEKSYKFIGTKQEKRGQLILDAGNFYLQYSETMKLDSNKTASESFVNYISTLSDETKTIDVKKAEKTLVSFYENVSSVTNRNVTEQVAGMDSNLDKLNQLHTLLPDGKFKDQVAELMKEINDVRKLLADEKTRGQVSEEEIKRLDNITGQTFYMANMLGQLESKETIKNVNNLYGNSLEALLSGKQNEADLHVFSGVEYLASEEDAKYQKDIVKKSNDLAAGKINYETAFTFVYSKLYKEAKARKDGQLDGVLESYPEKITPEEMDMEKVISLKQGIHISQELENKLKDAPEELKPGINQLASNAYAALDAGQLDIVDIQKEFMSNYVNVSADWEKQGIFKLSGMLGENPELVDIALQYINFSRNTSPIKNIEYSMKSGSPEHSVIQSYRNSLEMLEMKILNGETLTKEEIALGNTLNDAAITFGQIIEDPKLGKDIKEKSTELYGNAGSLLNQGDMEKAMLMFYGASLLPSLSKEERESVVSISSGVMEGTYTLQDTKSLFAIYDEKISNTSDRGKTINYYENKIEKLKKEPVKNAKEIEKIEKTLKHLNFVQNKLTGSYNTAIEFWNKGDYNSATLVANAAGIQAQIYSLPAKSRKEGDVKEALDYANSLVKDAKTALKNDETIAKTEPAAGAIAQELQLHTVAVGYSQLNSDFEDVNASATESKYKQENADYEYVISKGNEALKLYEDGNKKIEQALKLTETDKEAAKTLMVEGLNMVESAKAIMLAVTNYNTSIMKIKTKSKEAGRTDLLDAMKIYSALGNGQVLDSSGEILLDEKGKPVKMDAKTANMYAHAGQNLLASGIQDIMVQSSITKTKKKLTKQSNKMLKATELEQEAVAKQGNIMQSELVSLNNQLAKENSELAQLNKELKKAKKDKDTAKAAKIGEDVIDSKKKILDLGKQITELSKDIQELSKATGDIGISQNKSKKAKKQAVKENFMGASKSLGSAYGWLTCASKTREIFANKTMLKNDQKQVYGKVGGEVTSIVGDVVNKSAVPDAIANEAENMLNITPPGLKVYDSDIYTASVDQARSALTAGNNQGADKVISDLGINMEQDFDQQQITNHEGAYAQGKKSLEWFSLNLPEFFMSPGIKGENNIQKKKREDTNGLIAEGLKPFQTELWYYAQDMGAVAGKWSKASDMEISMDDAIAFENEKDDLFQERALAWKTISPQLKFAASEMSNINMVDLYSKAPAITKEQTMALLKSSENFSIAETALEQADNFSNFLKSPQGVMFAQSILDQNKQELEAMGALSLSPEETKNAGSVMANWTTEVMFGRMGYKVIWEGGKVAGLEKVSLTNEEIIAYENAFTNFENMRNMFTTNLTGGSGLISKGLSAEDELKVLGAVTKAAEHYHNANMAILNGEGVGTAEDYIAKGDAWTKVEHYTVEAGWKGQAKSFMASNIATAPLAVAWSVYDAKKGKLKKEKLTEIEYRQYQFQQTEMKVRMVKLGGDIAISGTLFALAPVTGGTSALAAAGYMTMTSTMGLTEFWHSTGGWQYMTGKEKTLFVFDASMTVAMAALPVGGLIIGEAGGIAMSVQGAAKEGMQLTKGMQTFAKVVELGGKGMMYSGIARGLVDAPNILEGVSSGNMSLAEAGLIFANMALPLVQMKLYTARVAKAAKGGAPPEYVYRSKPQQFLEALILGEPIDDPFMHYMAKESQKISEITSTMAPENLTAYKKHLVSQEKTGNPLTIPEQMDLLEKFDASGKANLNDFLLSEKTPKLTPKDSVQFEAYVSSQGEKIGEPMSSEQKLDELAGFEQFKKQAATPEFEVDFGDYQLYKKWQQDPSVLSEGELGWTNDVIIKTKLDTVDKKTWESKNLSSLDAAEQAFVLKGYLELKEKHSFMTLDLYTQTFHYDVAKAKTKLDTYEHPIWNNFIKEAGITDGLIQKNILDGYLQWKEVDPEHRSLDLYLIETQLVGSDLTPIADTISQAKKAPIVPIELGEVIELVRPIEIPKEVEVAGEMKMAVGSDFVPTKKPLPLMPEDIREASPSIDDHMNQFIYTDKPTDAADKIIKDFFNMDSEQQDAFIKFCNENAVKDSAFGDIANLVENAKNLRSSLSEGKEKAISPAEMEDWLSLLKKSRKGGKESGEQEILAAEFFKLSEKQKSALIEYCKTSKDSENSKFLESINDPSLLTVLESSEATAGVIKSFGSVKRAGESEKSNATSALAFNLLSNPETISIFKKYCERRGDKFGLEFATAIEKIKAAGGNEDIVMSLAGSAQYGTTKDLVTNFLKLDSDGQNAILDYCRLAEDKKNFGFLKELDAMMGDKGVQLADVFNVSHDELVKIYTDNERLTEIRKDLLEKFKLSGIQFSDFPPGYMNGRKDDYLKFNSLSEDYFLWGMLIEGGLLLELKNMGDNFNIQFRRGAWGSYQIDIESPAGIQTLFLKKLDCVPDKNAADYSQKSGHPAPEVYTKPTAPALEGKEFIYTNPLGLEEKFGLIQHLKDYSGELNLSGMDVKVKTKTSDNLRDVSTNNELKWVLEEDNFPKFMEEIGYMQEAAMQTGFWDRHELNIWFMKMEVEGTPKPLTIEAETWAGMTDTQKKIEAKNYLQGEGHMVELKEGNLYVYKFGNIDLDTGGFYMMSFNPEGSASFKDMVFRFGTEDIFRIFNDLYKKKHPNNDISFEQFVDKHFETFLGGAERWLSEHSNENYKQSIIGALTENEGQPVGMAKSLDSSKIKEIYESKKSEYDHLSTQGLSWSPLMDAYGRVPVISEGEKVVHEFSLSELKKETSFLDAVKKIYRDESGELILKETADSIGATDNLIEQGAEVISFQDQELLFIPPKKIDKAYAAIGGSQVTKLEEAGAVFKVFKDKPVAEYDGADMLADGTIRVVSVSFQKRELYGINYMSNDNQTYYLVPWDVIPESQKEGYPLPLGFPKPENFKVYAADEVTSLPADLQEKAVAAKRFQNTVILEEGGGKKLGLDPDTFAEVGAAKCAEYLLETSIGEQKEQIWYPVKDTMVKKWEKLHPEEKVAKELKAEADKLKKELKGKTEVNELKTTPLEIPLTEMSEDVSSASKKTKK